MNGPPGVGKSALAQRFVDAHPLALHLDIDAIRCSLGRWDERPESKVVARSLALAMAEAHLRAGHDVILGQYVGRPDFIEALDRLAGHAGARFVEFILDDTMDAVVTRFRARRLVLSAESRSHPQADIDDASVEAEIAGAFERLRAVAAERPDTKVVAATEGLEAAYEQFRRALGEGAPPP